MSILGNIINSVVHKAKNAAATASATPASGPTLAPTSTPTPAATPAPGTARPAANVDVEAVLNKLAAENPQRLDWRNSIVDLMKLLNLDSSLAARKELAKDLHYTGNMNNTAEMNMWLHKQVMIKLAENGGKVPSDLLHA